MTASAQTTAMIEHADIDRITARHREAAEHYGRFFESLYEARKALGKAQEAVVAGSGSPFSLPAWVGMHHSPRDRRPKELDDLAALFEPRDLVIAEAAAARCLDLHFWSSIVDRSEVEQLMDAQLKKELRDQLRYVPARDARTEALVDPTEASGLPPFGAEAVEEVVYGFARDARKIYLRGLANVFGRLSPRFRSHDTFRLKHRVIFENAFDRQFRYWNARYETTANIRDVERALAIVDGRDPKDPPPSLVDLSCDRSLDLDEPLETDYFRCRFFRNGNVHLWFRSGELLDKLNALLAEYYGPALGAARPDPDVEQDPFDRRPRRSTPRKHLGFFPTPPAVVSQALGYLSWWSSPAPLRVLEPSAGTGNLASPLAADGHSVDVVELQPVLAADLEASGLYRSVRCADFLDLEPEPVYDLVVMNPPFDRDLELDHARHALRFLRPGGRFLAILSSGARFRETRKAVAWRQIVEQHANHLPWIDLPPGSFEASGTCVNTTICRFRLPD